MDNKAKIGRILEDGGLRHWGVASFVDTLPVLPCRAASRLPRDAKSVIVCLLGYYAGERAHNISRYAWARDYHLLVEELLSPVAERMRETWQEQTFAVFTDNSPIREVTAARLAGLGFIGNNGLLISPGLRVLPFHCGDCDRSLAGTVGTGGSRLWRVPALPGCLVRQERCPLSEWKKAGAGPISLRKKGI